MQSTPELHPRPHPIFLIFAPSRFHLPKHNISCHCYVDDMQLYLPLNPGHSNNSTLGSLLDCLQDIEVWMAINYLQLNDGKTTRGLLWSSDFLPPRKGVKKSPRPPGTQSSHSCQKSWGDFWPRFEIP